MAVTVKPITLWRRNSNERDASAEPSSPSRDRAPTCRSSWATGFPVTRARGRRGLSGPRQEGGSGGAGGRALGLFDPDPSRRGDHRQGLGASITGLSRMQT